MNTTTTKNHGISRLGRFVLLVTAVLIGNSLALAGSTQAGNTPGTPAYWQKGLSLLPYVSPDDWKSATSDAALASAKQTNANYVTLIVPHGQTHANSTTIYRESFAPTDDAIIHAITTVHQQGMKVAIKPHVDPTDEWRAYINPQGADRDTWYANYTAMLYHFVDIAIQYNVEELMVGAELIKMATYTENPDNTRRWNIIIDGIRSKGYKGLLTYSANWGGSDFTQEFTHIGFWNKLDFIGISAYFPVGTYNDPSVADLKATWDQYRVNVIEPYQKSIGKPVLFTEVGYRSYRGSTQMPWESSYGLSPTDFPYDEGEQSNAVQALADYWGSYSWFAGLQYWWWYTNVDCCRNQDRDYYVQNKKGQTTMHDWFGNFVTQPTNPTFTLASSSLTPTSGQPTTTFNLSASLQSDINYTASVVARWYDSNNTEIYHQTISSYGFVSNQPHTFSFSLPGSVSRPPGNYYVSLTEVNPANAQQVYSYQPHAGSVAVVAPTDCTIVTDSVDNGQCGGLSQAIAAANTGPTRNVTFNLNSPTQPVHLAGPGAVTVGSGTSIVGSCVNGQPTIKIVGDGNPGLILNGAHLTGLSISGFKGPQIVAHSSVLKCVQVSGAVTTPAKAAPVAPTSSLAAPQRADLLAATKPLMVVSVEHPVSFRGTGRSATKPAAGQQLMVVTVDFDRSPTSHLLSSQNGDVYLTNGTDGLIYYTVDTGLPTAEPPGQAPGHKATFVFSVPDGTSGWVFHYGPKYLRSLDGGK